MREEVYLSSALRGKPSRLQEKEGGSLPVISLERKAVKAPGEGGRRPAPSNTLQTNIMVKNLVG